MFKKREVLMFETSVPGVEVHGATTDWGGLFIQIRDTKLDDALLTNYIDPPLGLSEEFVVGHLKHLASSINEKVFDGLLVKYIVEKYALYQKNGWASNFTEFQQKFAEQLEDKEMASND